MVVVAVAVVVVVAAATDVVALLCAVLPPREGMISGAAGARRMLPVGAVSRLSHSVVAGDMLCLARWLCTGWNAEW